MLEAVRERVAGRSVLCAVSGGVDSVVLLHLLRRCGVRVAALHVEHGIRGESSLRDCAFVEDLCRRWGVELCVRHIDVPAQATRLGRGLEETARQMRYALLEEQRAALGLDCIATAHHLNDQAETLLLHLVRGASPKGMEGMAPERGALIRPLLAFPRAEIERYAREHNLPSVTDETNADTAYARNFLRHEVLPRLETLNPRVVEAMGRLAELSRAQNDYIAQQARDVLQERMHGAALDDVRDVHPGLRGAVLAMYLDAQGARDVTQADISRLEGLLDKPAGRRVSLGKDLFERDTKGVRRVIMEPQPASAVLRLGENVTPLGTFTLEYADVPRNLDLGADVQALDADKAGDSLIVRTRRSGDRVRLLGGSGTKLVSDVLTDKKVPRALRGAVPLIERDGEILWIAGIAPCAPCAIDAGSRRALIIKYKRPKE